MCVGFCDDVMCREKCAVKVRVVCESVVCGVCESVCGVCGG